MSPSLLAATLAAMGSQPRARSETSPKDYSSCSGLTGSWNSTVDIHPSSIQQFITSPLTIHSFIHTTSYSTILPLNHTTINPTIHLYKHPTNNSFIKTKLHSASIQPTNHNSIHSNHQLEASIQPPIISNSNYFTFQPNLIHLNYKLPVHRIIQPTKKPNDDPFIQLSCKPTIPHPSKKNTITWIMV